MNRMGLVIVLFHALAAMASAAAPSVSALAYSPDGRILAAGTHGRVSLLDSASGDWLQDVTGPTGRVTALSFARTGTLAIASGEPGLSGRIQILSNTLEKQHDWQAHKDAVYALAFSPNGDTLATAGYDRTIKLWAIDGKAPAAPRLTLTDHSDAIYAVTFHPSGKLLASASADRTVKLWDVASGKRLYTLSDSTDWLYALSWAPAGDRLAAAGVDKSIRVWEVNASEGKLIQSVFAHEGAVTHLAYSPDGKRLYSVGEDTRVKAWDALRLTETLEFPRQGDPILSFAIRPDAKQLAIGRFDGNGFLIDSTTAKPGSAILPARPKPPAVTRLSPDSAVRGNTVKLLVQGTRLQSASSVRLQPASAGSVRLLGKPSANQAELECTLSPTAPVGAVQVILESKAGASDPVTLIVDRFPLMQETGLTDSAQSAMPVPLPSSISGRIDRAGDCDYFTLQAEAGQQIGIEVTTSAIGSKLDPVLTLSNENGQILSESSMATGLIAPQAGRYAIGIRDRDYRGGPDFTYRLHVGPVPVITSIFPLAIPRGRSADVHLAGVNLGSPLGRILRVTVPADAAPGSSQAIGPIQVQGETPLGPSKIIVAEFPSVIVSPESGAELRNIPGSADGILNKPREAQTVRFQAKSGERLIIETHARRLGSPVDPIVEVLDSAGNVVPQATLRCVAKTYTTFRDHDSSKPGIRLDTWNELATNDYLYVGSELMRINALPRNPDDDCQFVQVAGQRVGFLGTTPTHHAQNTPMFKVEIHPPGKTFPPNGMPVFTIPFENDDGGPGIGKDSYLSFDPPSDGLYQVRVRDVRGQGGADYAYRLTVRVPRPDFSLNISSKAANVGKGNAMPVTITATRTDGFTGPIRIKPTKVPVGFEVPETLIEESQNSTTFALYAGNEATTGPLAFEGEALIGNQAVKRSVMIPTVKAVDAGDLETTTSVRELKIVPGKETRFVVRIERRNGFKGRVPVDVRGLPHGVRVLNVGLNGILITERDTMREVVLYAEPWVQPMTMPIVVLARVEGKGTEHAARSVSLTVVKE